MTDDERPVVSGLFVLRPSSFVSPPESSAAARRTRRRSPRRPAAPARGACVRSSRRPVRSRWTGCAPCRPSKCRWSRSPTCRVTAPRPTAALIVCCPACSQRMVVFKQPRRVVFAYGEDEPRVRRLIVEELLNVDLVLQVIRDEPLDLGDDLIVRLTRGDAPIDVDGELIRHGVEGSGADMNIGDRDGRVFLVSDGCPSRNGNGGPARGSA